MTNKETDTTDNAASDALAERAGALPEALTPARDLWPGIRAQMEAPHERRTLPGFAIAAAALVAVSISLTWWIGEADQLQPEVALVMAAPDPHLLKVRTELRTRVEAALLNLSPETRAVIAENLDRIELARRDIEAALQGNPDSRLLQTLMLSTYTNELTMLSELEGMTHSAKRRTQL